MVGLNRKACAHIVTIPVDLLGISRVVVSKVFDGTIGSVFDHKPETNCPIILDLTLKSLRRKSAFVTWLSGLYELENPPFVEIEGRISEKSVTPVRVAVEVTLSKIRAVEIVVLAHLSQVRAAVIPRSRHLSEQFGLVQLTRRAGVVLALLYSTTIFLCE
jgi:hypothetical protein